MQLTPVLHRLRNGTVAPAVDERTPVPLGVLVARPSGQAANRPSASEHDGLRVFAQNEAGASGHRVAPDDQAGERPARPAAGNRGFRSLDLHRRPSRMQRRPDRQRAYAVLTGAAPAPIAPAKPYIHKQRGTGGLTEDRAL